jgi:L-2,4-diaminobutyric acid acetyltransferase
MSHGLPLPVSPASEGEIHLRSPLGVDGTAVHALVARCPPLDTNSLYCNLLQCSMFSSTCVLAERNHDLAGFVSAFVLPAASSCLFVWQVAVAPEARGIGLAQRMLLELLTRPECQQVVELRTTITQGNAASWALFGSLARTLGARVRSEVCFDRHQHFNNQHDTEMLVTIGRFTPCAAAAAALKSRLRHLT